MRIFFAVPSYWPSQDGVANITGYLAEGLAKRGHEVLVFTSAGNGGLQELPYEEEHAGVKIERMRVYVRWPLKLKGRDKKSTRKAYLARIKSFAPDVLVVVCSQTWTLDWVKRDLDKIKCRKVFYSHGYSKLSEKYFIREQLRHRNIVGAFQEWKIKKYYKSLHNIVRKFDLALYLSELNNSWIYAQQHNVDNGKILENAIEDIFLDESMIHSKESFNNEQVQYLYVANYNDNKNQDMLLKAFCEANIESATLQMVGFEENDYLNMLREHLELWMPSNCTKKVIFNVHLSRSEIYTLYKESNVFVSTSKSENAPIVHCEAAATGMPVISTDVGDVSLKDGIILVKDEKQLKEAIERLWINRTEMSERGNRLREYMLTRKCRVVDKVDWLENELRSLCQE